MHSCMPSYLSQTQLYNFLVFFLFPDLFHLSCPPTILSVNQKKWGRIICNDFLGFYWIFFPSKHFRNSSILLLHHFYIFQQRNQELIPFSKVKTRMNSVFALKNSKKYQSINPCNIPLATVMFFWQGRKYFSYQRGHTEQITETTGNWAVSYHRPYWCLFKLYFEEWGEGVECPQSS